MSVLERELEQLRNLLASSPPRFQPFSSLAGNPSGQRADGKAADVMAGSSLLLQTPVQTRSYAANLSTAERSVDRLGKAIEAAEEEMEAALRRTTEVHRSQLRQKETELSEAQRLLAAKERSIDSLRDTLSTTKRALESRLSQAESALATAEAQVIALREELSVAHLERDSVQAQLQKALAAQNREAAEFRSREAELATQLRLRAEEANRAAAAASAQHAEASHAQAEMADLRRQVELLADELRVIRVESRADKERLEAEADALRRQLRHEMSVRKACEKWMKSELRSREEMEVLLSAIRDTAHQGAPRDSAHLTLGSLTGSPAGRGGDSGAAAAALAAADALEVEALLTGLRRSPARSPVRVAPKAAASKHIAGGAAGGRGGGGFLAGVGAFTPHQQVVELELQNAKVHEDNRRLKSELAAARKLLKDRLGTY